MRACIGPSGKLLCVCMTNPKNQHIHGNTSYLFDYRANPVVHWPQIGIIFLIEPQPNFVYLQFSAFTIH